MAEFRVVLCVLGAFIGADFASGREVFRFFTCQGILSVPLILLSGALTVVLTEKWMRRGETHLSSLPFAAMLPLLLLLLTAGGGMTASAGELFALTIPLHDARSLGMAVSLLLGLCFSKKTERSISLLTLLFLPLLLFSLLLCLRTGNGKTPPSVFPGFSNAARGGIGALSWVGMNVMLSLGAVCTADKACTRRAGCRCALWAGGTVTVLLLLYNRALLPHAEALRDAPLPLVVLLRGYGKEGYYLSAAVLYFAVMTTLTAVLRSARDLMATYFPGHTLSLCGLLTGVFSLAGFERITAIACPVPGLICFFLLLFPPEREPRPCREGKTVLQ